MDIHIAHLVRVTVRRQQPVHQALQAVGLVDDDLGVFGQRRVGQLQFHCKQLRSAAQAAQRVLDFMGQVADQVLVRLGLLAQAFFALLAYLLRQRPQLDQYFVGQIGSRHADMHRHRFLRWALQTGFKP